MKTADFSDHKSLSGYLVFQDITAFDNLKYYLYHMIMNRYICAVENKKVDLIFKQKSRSDFIIVYIFCLEYGKGRRGNIPYYRVMDIEQLSEG